MFFQEFFRTMSRSVHRICETDTHMEIIPFVLSLCAPCRSCICLIWNDPSLCTPLTKSIYLILFSNIFSLVSVLDFSIFLIERFQPILRDCNIAKRNAIQFLYLSAFLKTKVVLFYCRVNRLISVHVDLNYKCKRNVSSTCLSFWSY